MNKKILIPKIEDNRTIKKINELDPLGIYTEEELQLLKYIRAIPDEIKEAMHKLTQDL